VIRAIPKAVRARWAGIIASAAIIALGWLAGPDGMGRLDGAVYDRFQRSVSVQPVVPITVVSVDGASTGRVGAWPWRSDVLAHLVERLNAAGARVIAFSTSLPAFGAGEDSPTGPDARLETSMRAHGSVVVVADPGHEFVDPPGIQFGHGRFTTDPDGVVRSAPAVANDDDRVMPSLALIIAARALDLRAGDIVRERPDRLRLGSLRVPLDRGVIRPEFLLSTASGRPEEIPAWQVLDEDWDSAALQGRIVIIGHAGERLETPVAGSQPQAHVVAATVASLMAGDTIVHSAWARLLEWLVAIVVVLVVGLRFPALGFWQSLALASVMAAGAISLELTFLFAAGVWVALAVPALAAIVGWTVVRASFLDVVRPRAAEHRRPEQRDSMRVLAQTFQQQGKFDLAFETLRQCVSDAATLEGLYSLGLAYERTGQPGLAAGVFRHIVGLDPAYRDAAARVTLDNTASTMGFESHAVLSGDLPARPPDKAATPAPTIAHLGRYEIERELGKGAMGVVYLGRDPKINRIVAIKAIALAEEFQDEDLAEAKARFFREAEMAGRLNHPGIVTIYDVGEEDTLAFIAMELLRGEHLSLHTEQNNLLDPCELLGLGARVADALHYAHRQNVVHRDIKPANIMFDRLADDLKITDFGIARLTDTSRTKTGIVLGTPSFMAPEQLEGRQLDGRSDLFSLGISLYQLLAGQLPFRAESMTRLMQKIATEPHAPIRSVRPELPDCVEAILATALAKNPDDRFQTGAEFAEALRDCATRFAA
jgi:serine/threonine-protein kinase